MNKFEMLKEMEEQLEIILNTADKHFRSRGYKVHSGKTTCLHEKTYTKDGVSYTIAYWKKGKSTPAAFLKLFKEENNDFEDIFEHEDYDYEIMYENISNNFNNILNYIQQQN